MIGLKLKILTIKSNFSMTEIKTSLVLLLSIHHEDMDQKYV
jgi:hypothetical protein